VPSTGRRTITSSWKVPYGLTRLRVALACSRRRARSLDGGRGSPHPANALKGPAHPAAANLYERIRARFALLVDADDLEIPPREPGRDPPRFD
jgi:hypothetical protein